MGRQFHPGSRHKHQATNQTGPSLPTSQWTEGTFCAPALPPGYPRDEYLCDGGDTQLGAKISPEWQTYGIEPTDTVAHFDTLDGRTLVEPSNRVCVYAPRFGAVRTIARMGENQQIDAPADIELTNGAVMAAENLPVVASTQRYSPVPQTGVRTPSDYHTLQIEGLLADQVVLRGYQDALLPYENFKLIAIGVYDAAEKARLAKSVAAAIQWTHELGVNVLIDAQTATAVTKEDPGQTVYTVERDDHPALRLCKVANTGSARPGETIEFTIRFDNVGDVVIGNVVILDNLATRLEYVAGSAESSVKSQFAQTTNEAGSLMLRWELEEPLEPGQGGIVRFKCLVR